MKEQCCQKLQILKEQLAAKIEKKLESAIITKILTEIS